MDIISKSEHATEGQKYVVLVLIDLVCVTKRTEQNTTSYLRFKPL